MTKSNDFDALEEMKRLAPGFYTERDGGQWYVVTPQHGRVAEEFESREDARRLTCWLAGAPLPEGWRIVPHGSGDLSYDVEIPNRYTATIWAREARTLFPGRAAALAKRA